MEITVTGKHLEITDAIRQYAVEKSSKLPRYFDRIQEINIIADRRENRTYEVDLIVHVARRESFVARSRGEDLYACVDEVNTKMERQLTDHKERLRNRKHPAPY